MPRSSAASIRVPLLLLACAAVANVTVCLAQSQSAADEQETAQLLGLAQVWATTKYFHPYLAYRPIDWDKALVTAIPAATAARTTQQYAAAIQGMLDALQDPVTRVIEPAAQNPPKASVGTLDTRGPADRDPRMSADNDGVLVVTVSHYNDLLDYSGTRKKFLEIGKQPMIRGLVFDLRTATAVSEEARGMLAAYLDEPAIAGQFVAAPTVTPPERRRMYSGLPDGGPSYFSATYAVDGVRIEPVREARDVPVVFLVNQRSELPRVAIALQSEGKAAIVADGEMPGDEAIVTTQLRDLPRGLIWRLRLGELVAAGGKSGLQADLTLHANASKETDAALVAARTLVTQLRPNQVPARSLPAAQDKAMPERNYPEMRYPPLEYRLLAAFRIWAVFDYFYPYKDLTGEDWDVVLREFIPRFRSAGNEQEYALTVAEMLTHVHDTHVTARGSVPNEIFGTAAPPLRVRMIEGTPVVTRLLDEGAAAAQGVRVGDVVIAVDGERAGDRIARLSKYISASTPQALDYRISSLLLRGPESSTARLSLKGSDGQTREISLLRQVGYASPEERDGEAMKILPGNIGYVDLERLTPPEVDAMFERLKDTKAIIFDMRGYPKGTAWVIAPRLSQRPEPVAALFRVPVLLEPESTGGQVVKQRGVLQFEQRVPLSGNWRYTGKTVMLIDERAVSQSEHTGLFLRAANGTKFVGSPTNGADGDVTSFFIPGDIRIRLTGASVSHPDGSQLQRVGLVPDVEVRPTIDGVRSGRDEVLERAVDYLNGR